MTLCAREGCGEPLPPHRRGRRPIYCSPACRPSLRTRPSGLSVEVDHPEETDDGRPAGRVWTVRLRRGRRAVVIAEGLGWPSANALVIQLEDLLRPQPRRQQSNIG